MHHNIHEYNGLNFSVSLHLYTFNISENTIDRTFEKNKITTDCIILTLAIHNLLYIVHRDRK